MVEITPIQPGCYSLLCLLATTVLFMLKRRRGLNLPPGPWALPVLGHMHCLLGALPHQAVRRLAQVHGPVMLLRLGHVPTLVISSADIFTYGGADISFARGPHWKALCKLCATELFSPRSVRSFRAVQEEEAARLARSVAAAGGGAVVNVGEMAKVMMNDVIMRASVGDRCAQRDAYLEELDRVLDLMSGFNLTDMFPTSRLAKVLGGRALKATWEMHRRIHVIMEAMISDSGWKSRPSFLARPEFSGLGANLDSAR